ncbi:MAG: phosphate ABC transporter substrate-binding protein [Bacteroidia bacterium]|nr:phosphate ABC transporter substrate-binding protein [Bacteroidia bacterium]
MFNSIKVLILFVNLSLVPVVIAQETHIYISGSETMKRMMIRLAEAYMKKNPNVIIDVKGGHSEKGLEDLRTHKADICATTKPPVTTIQEEMSSFYEEPLIKKVIATEALAVFVHKKNPVKQISCEQLADIFAGKITNWKQIGGKNAPIKVFRMPDLSGTSQTFQSLLMLNKKYAEQMPVKNSSQEMVAEVEKDANAIAYGKLSHVTSNVIVLPLQDCDNLSVDKNFYPATVENINQNKYIFVRQLYLMTHKKTKPEVKNFLDWAATEEAQNLIAEMGFIPVKSTKK